MTADDRLKEYRKADASGDLGGFPCGRSRERSARRRRLETRPRDRGGRPFGRRTTSVVDLTAAVLALAFVAAPPVGATPPGEPGRMAPATWSQLEGIAGLLTDGGWRRAARRTDNLLAEVSGEKWREPDLDRLLATLTFYRAVVRAHRGEVRAALWDWHMALNLDPEQGERDLAPYGRAAELFTEKALRAAGRPPPGVDVPEPYGAGLGYQLTVPVLPEKEMPLVNNHFKHERIPTVGVEVVVGPDGLLSHPVVTTPWVHPVALWWSLEAMRLAGPFEPARLDGEPIAALYVLEQDFDRAGKF